ncbi:MAG: hypothetical protein M1832_003651 [Thelocarpon impressellum]|nr:MAG: hypothetical protein M1832_003651 [Thelocarpon impressellum]
MRSHTLAAVAVVGWMVPAAAAAADETVHAAVVFNRYGEHTPLMVSGPTSLTPLGATQMLDAGSFLRDRYIDGSDNDDTSPIRGLSKDVLKNEQLYALAGGSETVAASAQAFFQGLYPPLDAANVTEGGTLANGSAVESPLGGYQYAHVYAVTDVDLNAVWVNGDANCPQHTVSRLRYKDTAESKALSTETSGFYSGLESKALGGDLDALWGGYSNAYGIYDYVNYGYTHNATVRKLVSADDLARLRALADRREFAMNGDLSVSGASSGDMIRAVSGRTLAAKVVALLRQNIRTQGRSYKLSAMFGGYEPFLAFAALAQLPRANPNFYGLPQVGSSMAFELFSVGNATAYPKDADLMVRFVLRNGTGADADARSYPLFGRGLSRTDMTWADFQAGMDTIKLARVGDWCDACSSRQYYCTIFSSKSDLWGSSPSATPSASRKRALKPAVAGALGAAVTLGVLFLCAAAAALVFGVRVSRVGRRRSDLGGFKGSEKLASDADLARVLPAPAAAVVAGATVKGGHERVGSWELRDRNEHDARFGSLARDGAAHPGHRVDDDEVSIIDPAGEGVKADERV